MTAAQEVVLVRFDLWNVWALSAGQLVVFGAGFMLGSLVVRLLTRERRGTYSPRGPFRAA